MSRLSLSRRALMIGTVLAAAGCTSAPAEPEPESTPSGPKPETDRIAPEITVLERGHMFESNDNGDFMHVGFLLENQTADAFYVNTAVMLLDDERQTLRKGAVGIPGRIYVPPFGTVGAGDCFSLSDEIREKMKSHTLWVRVIDSTLPLERVTATVTDLEDHEAWPLIHFTATNPDPHYYGSNYCALFRGADGAIRGGFIFDRNTFPDYKNHIPSSEDEFYPKGDSEHVLPCSYPPDQDPALASIHVWRGRPPGDYWAANP